MTGDSMAEAQFTGKVAVALERWLDYMASLDASTLAAATYGLRRSVAYVMDAGSVETAGMFDALAELMDAMREARVAMDEENTE